MEKIILQTVSTAGKWLARKRVGSAYVTVASQTVKNGKPTTWQIAIQEHGKSETGEALINVTIKDGSIYQITYQQLENFVTGKL